MISDDKSESEEEKLIVYEYIIMFLTLIQRFYVENLS